MFSHIKVNKLLLFTNELISDKIKFVFYLFYYTTTHFKN